MPGKYPDRPPQSIRENFFRPPYILRFLHHSCNLLYSRTGFCFWIPLYNMSAIGSLIFCTDCGNLLQESTGNENATVVCEVCGARNKGILTLSGISFMAHTNSAFRHRSPDHCLRIQTERFPIFAESQKICRPNFDGCGQEDGGPHPAYMCQVWQEGNVLYNCAIAQCRRRKYGVLHMRVRI